MALHVIGPGIRPGLVRDLRDLADNEPEKRPDDDDHERGEPEQVLGVHGVTTKARIVGSIGIDRSASPDRGGRLRTDPRLAGTLPR